MDCLDFQWGTRCQSRSKVRVVFVGSSTSLCLYHSLLFTSIRIESSIVRAGQSFSSSKKETLSNYGSAISHSVVLLGRDTRSTVRFFPRSESSSRGQHFRRLPGLRTLPVVILIYQTGTRLYCTLKMFHCMLFSIYPELV